MAIPAAKRKWRLEIGAPASPAGAGDCFRGGHRGSESPSKWLILIAYSQYGCDARRAID